MAAADRARKLLIRTAFVTSTTIATLVGAQNLAMLDAKQFLPTETDSGQNTTALQATDTALQPPVTSTLPDATIVQVAPSITILRQSGQQTILAQQTIPAASNTNTTTVIQPPAAQVAAPQAVVVQQASRQRTRSSK
jgi:hypothetical protein